MRYSIRIPEPLLHQVHQDLSRRHAHAHERVGFFYCKVADAGDQTIILAERYEPVADEDYLVSDQIGALMGPAAIRKALQSTYKGGYAMFHVHRHEHRGTPGFSRVDLSESAKFVPDFWKVAPRRPHGTLVLSHDEAAGLAWCPQTRQPVPIADIYSVGTRLHRLGGSHGRAA